MNKYLLTLLMLTPLLANGQFLKGDKFIGGTFRLSSHTLNNPGQGETYQVKGFSINPFMGFLVKENFAIGSQIGYSYFNTTHNIDQPTERKYTRNGFNVGLISRRYFSISEKFVVAINGNLRFDRGTETDITSSSESKTQDYQIGVEVSPSLIFFPSPKWGLEASVGSLSYSHSKNLSTDTGNNYFNLEYGPIYLGLSYYFRGSKE